jgi:hypothetical protein
MTDAGVVGAFIRGCQMQFVRNACSELTWLCLPVLIVTSSPTKAPRSQNTSPERFNLDRDWEAPQVRLEQECVPLLDKFSQLSSRLGSLHLLQSLVDRTPGMNESLRSLKLRKLDLPSILNDNTYVGVTLLAKCSPEN